MDSAPILQALNNLGCNIVHFKQGHVAQLGEQHFLEKPEKFRLGLDRPSAGQVAQAVAAKIRRDYEGQMVSIRDINVVLSDSRWVAYTAIGKMEN